jgi:hypothetical protein
MMHKAPVIAAAVATVMALVSCQSRDEVWPQPIVDEIARTLGGADRILALERFTIEGEAQGPITLSERHEATRGPFITSHFSQTFQLAAREWNVEHTREAADGRPALRRSFGYRGGAAFDTGPDGVPQPNTSEEVRAFRRLAWHLHPLTITRAALEGAEQCCGRTFHARIFEIAMDRDAKTTLLVDKAGLLTSIYSDTIPGGDRLDASFDDYRDVDGWTLPFRIKVRIEVAVASEMGTLRRAGEMAVVVKSYRMTGAGG